MNTARFDSSLANFKLVKKGEDMFWILQMKVIEDTSIRSFPRQFQQDIDFNGAFDQSAAQDAWDKVNIPLDAYTLEYKVTFSELIFPAKLIGISATRKESNDGVWSTEYILSFVCDPEKDMIKNIAWYVKHKEPDPETGKKVLMTYNTVLEDLEENPIAEPEA